MNQYFIAALLLLKTAECLHVTTILDSVVLEKGSYIHINNFNDANYLSNNNSAYNQTFYVSITNNHQNFLFDLFVFEVDPETGNSEGIDCYLKQHMNLQRTPPNREEFTCHWNDTDDQLKTWIFPK